MKKNINNGIRKVSVPSLIHQTLIKPEHLLNIGWQEVKVDTRPDRVFYRLFIPYYCNIFELHLGDYPRTNPNCGILMIHKPKEVMPNLEPGKPDIVFEETSTTIATHVDTLERLEAIIQALVAVNI